MFSATHFFRFSVYCLLYYSTIDTRRRSRTRRARSNIPAFTRSKRTRGGGCGRTRAHSRRSRVATWFALQIRMASISRLRRPANNSGTSLGVTREEEPPEKCKRTQPKQQQQQQQRSNSNTQQHQQAKYRAREVTNFRTRRKRTKF